MKHLLNEKGQWKGQSLNFIYERSLCALFSSVNFFLML